MNMLEDRVFPDIGQTIGTKFLAVKGFPENYGGGAYLLLE
jgi:hypothetical protein